MKIILRNDARKIAAPAPARVVQSLEPTKQERTDRRLGTLIIVLIAAGVAWIGFVSMLQPLLTSGS